MLNTVIYIYTSCIISILERLPIQREKLFLHEYIMIIKEINYAGKGEIFCLERKKGLQKRMAYLVSKVWGHQCFSVLNGLILPI